MAIPGRGEAAQLVHSLHPPSWFLAHTAAVADVAAFLARRAAVRGAPLDPSVAEVAALLHDVDKVLPDDEPVRRLGHGFAGARWLIERGYPELAGAVAAHPVARLADERASLAWLAQAPLAELIVCYADKRAGQRLGPMAERFREWERRSPDHAAELRSLRPRAEALERKVCAAADVAPQAVRRLHWARAALARAASEVRPPPHGGAR